MFSLKLLSSTLTNAYRAMPLKRSGYRWVQFEASLSNESARMDVDENDDASLARSRTNDVTEDREEVAEDTVSLSSLAVIGRVQPTTCRAREVMTPCS